MVKFLSGIAQVTHHEIERKPVFWIVDFDLPEDLRERMSLSEIRPVCGEFLMGFYADPLPGDVIEYLGHKWKVVERYFWPNRYKAQGNRKVPKLTVSYLGSV